MRRYRSIVTDNEIDDFLVNVLLLLKDFKKLVKSSDYNRLYNQYIDLSEDEDLMYLDKDLSKVFHRLYSIFTLPGEGDVEYAEDIINGYRK